MNIFRTLSEDKRTLFNVTYKEHGTHNTVDKLGVHFAEEDGTWSAALPLCHFPSEQIEAIREMCCELIRRVISSEQGIKKCMNL